MQEKYGSIASLTRAFCDRTLRKSQWTHEAHLRVGLWHLLHASEEIAFDKSPLQSILSFGNRVEIFFSAQKQDVAADRGTGIDLVA